MKAPLYITRELEFSAAHRLYEESWSEKENLDVFGKCAYPFGHGHNYVLKVTVEGLPDPKNHMIIHFSRLQRILDEVVVEPLDHRNLNHDVPFMKGILPTSENLVTQLWERVEKSFSGQPFRLYRLSLSSSPRNWVEYFGPEGAPRGGSR